MGLSGDWKRRRVYGAASPMTPTSFRILVAISIGAIIWVIWLTGMIGDSRQVTMLALSEVSILGTGLVVLLRHSCLAEETARQSEWRYRFLSENSFDMIVRFDPRTQRRTYISPAVCRLYGYTPEEALAISAADIIHPDDLPDVTAALSRLEAEPNQPPVLYRGKRKDGTYLWVEASLMRLSDPLTGTPEIVSIVRDVSDRIRYEEALRHAKDEADAANDSKSRFLATMSHELRTPLNAIIGFAEMLQREVLGPIGNEQYKSYVGDIHDSGTHLLQLINDILDLTKAEIGKLELHDEVIDVGEVVASVARMSRAAVDEALLTVSLDLPSGLPTLRADERQTRQVLFNLIGNAVKFTPAGGRIDIVARCDAAGGLRVTVSDNGIGIAPPDLARVTEPFVQVDSVFSRQHDGTGLGLAIAKAIMALHGGALELKSVVEVGTEASIVFPRERVVGAADPQTVPSAA